MRYARWAFWLILAIGIALGAAAMRLPAAKPAAAPTGEFAAGRALVDVRTMAREWHPIGSPGNTRVREALLARLEGMHLAPEVHVGVGIWVRAGSPRVLAGTVHNVVAVLPGRDRAAPAVLLMAHYDSTPASPGAADDIANVAAMLEIARILQAGPARERDVILLFTDGEEAGLLGADAFFRDDPWRERVGVVVNLEARGDAGPANMFETSRDAGALVRLYAAVAPRPHAQSLAAFVYAVLPNDTDFTNALRHDLPGLNVAFIGDQLAYHTPLATPSHLSTRTLQHVGDQVLPLVRALATAPTLPAAAPDATYFDVASRFVVAYPPAWGWWLLALAVALAVPAWRRAARQGVRPRDVALGFALAWLATLAAALALYVAGRLVVATADEPVFREFGRMHAGAIALGLGVALLVVGAAQRARRGPDGSTLGALAWLFVLAATVQLMAPRAAALYAWPLVGGTAIAALLAVGARPARTAAAALAIAFIAVVAPVEHGFFTALGPELPFVFALFVPPLFAVTMPYARAAVAARSGRIACAVLALAGIALFASVALLPAREAHPAVSELFFVAGAGDGAQWLVSPRERLAPWERTVLASDGGAPARVALPPFLPRPAWIAKARPRNVVPPAVSIARDGERVVVRGRATGGGRVLLFTIEASSPLGALRLGARALPASVPAHAPLTLRYAAPGDEEVTFDFVPAAADASVTVTLAEQRDGWPAGFAPAPRPANLMPWLGSDTTFALASAALP